MKTIGKHISRLKSSRKAYSFRLSESEVSPVPRVANNENIIQVKQLEEFRLAI